MTQALPPRAALTPAVTLPPHIAPRGRRTGLAAALVAAVFVGACASTVPPPTEQMAVSAAAVNSAVSAGATDLAGTEMRLARDKLALARTAMQAEDYARAGTLAREAQVDAQLAEAKARSSKARRAAEELQESTRVLQQELERKTAPK